MMSFHKPVLNAIVGMQSLAVMGESLKLVPKIKGKKIKTVKPKKMIKGLTKILIGTALIKPTAKLVNTI
jgi:hypothetical protein